MDRELLFAMYFGSLRGMAAHPGAGQRTHRPRSMKEDRDEACEMVIETDRLRATGFFRDPTIKVPPE